MQSEVYKDDHQDILRNISNALTRPSKMFVNGILHLFTVHIPFIC